MFAADAVRAMGIQSISVGKALPDGNFGQKAIIDANA